MTNLLTKAIEEAKKIAISGHVRPDGDCVGSCVGLRQYVKEQYPKKQVDIYLQPIRPEFEFLTGAQTIKNIPDNETVYDLFICLDCGDKERLGEFASMYENAKKTFCVDHHISNNGFADESVILADRSSTSEILCELLDMEKISKECAEAFYMGIVHDTGVFKHQNTTKKVMYLAGDLLEKGVNQSKIIDDTFFKKTYLQNQILGRALLESIMIMDGKVIFSAIKQNWFRFYGMTTADLDGIIDQLRITEGVEVAVLIYETEPSLYKVSMRSNEYIDVAKIAAEFGGGGHIRAAGCTIHGTSYDVINNITLHIEKQIIKLEAEEKLKGDWNHFVNNKTREISKK
ncbi:MAG: bifunctional oligoribonuclease/PAP phosphatase NrnA [Lachnospiraceae bacterium]